jgi:hypothetical protein
MQPSTFSRALSRFDPELALLEQWGKDGRRFEIWRFDNISKAATLVRRLEGEREDGSTFYREPVEDDLRWLAARDTWKYFRGKRRPNRFEIERWEEDHLEGPQREAHAAIRRERIDWLERDVYDRLRHDIRRGKLKRIGRHLPG